MQARAEQCLAGAAATSAQRAAGRAAMLVGGAHALLRFSVQRTPSPAAEAVAASGRRCLHDKPYRVHQLPRLRTVRSWHQFAPFVSGIKFRFDPAMDGTTGVKCVGGGITGEGVARENAWGA